MPFQPVDPDDADVSSSALGLIDSNAAPFVSAQELSDYLGRNVTTDAAGMWAVNAACVTVRTIAEQPFTRSVTTYVLDGSGTDALLLPHLPVTSAGSVIVNGDTITDYTLNSNGMLLRGTGGIDPQPSWPLGRQNVQVTADHGYDVVNVPQDVKMVALSLAARLVVQGVAVEEQVGSQRVKYAGPATELTNGEQAILRKYRPIR